MNRKLLSLLVTLVAMFGCLGSLNANTITLQASNSQKTPSITSDGVTLSISNVKYDAKSNGILGQGRHPDAFRLGENGQGEISWSCDKNILISKITISGNMGLLATKLTWSKNGGSEQDLFNGVSDQSKTINTTFENSDKIVLKTGSGAAYISKIEIEYTFVYKLKWNLDGGTATGNYTHEGWVSAGSDIVPPTVSKPEYKFICWEPAVVSPITADATYTASYQQIPVHYSKVYAYTVGNGQVSINETNSEGTYAKESSKSKNERVESPSHDYYLFAKADANSKFLGWSRTSNGEIESQDNPLNVEIIAKESEAEATIVYYARFELSTYYSTVSANSNNSNGNVFVNSEATDNDAVYSSTSEKTISGQSESCPTHTYYVYARSNNGCIFNGWKIGNEIVSQENPYILKIDNPSTTENNPRQISITAIFNQPTTQWTWAPENVQSGTHYWIKSAYTDKFLMNNNNANNDGTDATEWVLTSSQSGSETVWTIQDTESTPHYLYVYRSGNSNNSLKAGNFTSQTNKTNPTESDTQSSRFWIKQVDGNKYTMNVYVQYNDGSWFSSAKKGDVYVGVQEGSTTFSSESSVNDRCYWQFYSIDQVKLRDDYLEAWDKAMALGNGESEELKNELNNLMAPYASANMSNADKMISGLNSIVKVPLSVNTMGSFVAPFDVTLPNGVTAWITTDSESSDGYLTITQTATEGTLPANTPVILRGTGSQTYYGIAEGEENANGNGFLVGVYKDTTVPQGNYVLQKQTDEIMLYEVESDDIKLKAYRAYLNGSQVSGSKLRLVFSDETTGIATVEEEASVSAIYSASGAKLNAMQKGLNIIKMSNGSVKKVMVK